MASTLPDSIPFRASDGDARRSYAATLRTTNNTSAPSEGVNPTVPIPRMGHICPKTISARPTAARDGLGEFQEVSSGKPADPSHPLIRHHANVVPWTTLTLDASEFSPPQRQRP
jgi:hypothetical protein